MHLACLLRDSVDWGSLASDSIKSILLEVLAQHDSWGAAPRSSREKGAEHLLKPLRSVNVQMEQWKTWLRLQWSVKWCLHEVFASSASQCEKSPSTLASLTLPGMDLGFLPGISVSLDYPWASPFLCLEASFVILGYMRLLVANPPVSACLPPTTSKSIDVENDLILKETGLGGTHCPSLKIIFHQFPSLSIIFFTMFHHFSWFFITIHHLLSFFDSGWKASWKSQAAHQSFLNHCPTKATMSLPRWLQGIFSRPQQWA